MTNKRYTITSPVNISLRRWGSQLYIDLPTFTIPLPPLEPGEYWYDWANQIIKNNNLAGQVPEASKNTYPNPEDWRKWAAHFIKSF